MFIGLSGRDSAPLRQLERGREGAREDEAQLCAAVYSRDYFVCLCVLVCAVLDSVLFAFIYCGSFFSCFLFLLTFFYNPMGGRMYLSTVTLLMRTHTHTQVHT